MRENRDSRNSKPPRPADDHQLVLRLGGRIRRGGAVLASNMAGIRDLMLRSDIMLQGLALLFGGFGMIFGGVVCATAVMLLPMEEESETIAAAARRAGAAAGLCLGAGPHDARLNRICAASTFCGLASTRRQSPPSRRSVVKVRHVRQA